MQKPLTVAHQEFKDSIMRLINNSGLPAFILADTLSFFVRDLNSLASQQYQQDKEEYEKDLEVTNV